MSPSRFYDWQQRPDAAGTIRGGQLRVQIRASYTARRGRYGRPLVGTTSTEAGERVTVKRVDRLMWEEGLRAQARERFRSSTMSEHD